MKTHNLGFPRIGIARELKKAVESFWKGNTCEADLLETASSLRKRHWKLQQESGVEIIPVGDFSFYDHMLDACAMLGAVPERFEFDGDEVSLETYFTMARGGESAVAMEMTKWFDSNYHYIVPEFYSGQKFKLSSQKIFNELKEARNAGINPKVVLPGPVTFVHLGKETVEGFDRWQHLDAIVDVYCEVISAISKDCDWIQLDEPILVPSLPQDILEKYQDVYKRLKVSAGNSKLILATYFGSIADKMDTISTLPVDVLHIDAVRGAESVDDVLGKLPENIFLSVGVVDGRNIWRVNAAKAGSIISKAIDAIGIDRVMVAPSSSLLHVPIDIEPESKLDSEIKSWMSFAKQKCVEIAKLAADAKGEDVSGWLSENAEKISNRNSSKKVNNEPVQKRIKSLTGDDSVRKTVFAERKKLQQDKFNLPLMPTTTIGSFPQTLEIRSERRKFKKGDSSPGEYQTAMQGFIKDAVDKQIDLGLDVLVHGEPERNDMVEYFGEQLSGFCFTENGWVQSYGSRCVKPPVIFGDVSRPEPMTVDWIKYAQSLTTKPMKGMLTGPVTIMCWSFVRDDQPREATCRQLAVAIRDEVNDLEAAGIDIIQIDEAALREGLPLNKSEWDAYLSWAVECFRISTSGVKDTTQIHTHMCYSEFNEIAEWIAKMDADVISIEASRSKMELLKAFKDFNYPNDIGPGVYDIHSPRVPSTEEILELLECALEVIPAERLWINPDCGLKTRGWKESLESLKNMVNAAKAIRNKISVST